MHLERHAGLGTNPDSGGYSRADRNLATDHRHWLLCRWWWVLSSCGLWRGGRRRLDSASLEERGRRRSEENDEGISTKQLPPTYLLLSPLCTQHPTQRTTPNPRPPPPYLPFPRPQSHRHRQDSLPSVRPAFSPPQGSGGVPHNCCTFIGVGDEISVVSWWPAAPELDSAIIHNASIH